MCTAKHRSRPRSGFSLLALSTNRLQCILQISKLTSTKSCMQDMIDGALADRPDHGDVEFFGSYGIPASACVVAYDSIQRLLLVRSALRFSAGPTWLVLHGSHEIAVQVGTRDGRIKLVGTAAVERTLISKRRSATVSLNVLPNTGCFLRLESSGHLELWSIRLCKCLCTLSADVGDPIVSCCPLLNSPFALLGLGSGSLQCCAFVNAAGEHVGPTRPIEGLQWMPFTVPTDDINIPDDSELQHVASMQRCDGEFRVLLLHEYQTVTAMSLASGEVCPDQAPMTMCLARLAVGISSTSSSQQATTLATASWRSAQYGIQTSHWLLAIINHPLMVNKLLLKQMSAHCCRCSRSCPALLLASPVISPPYAGRTRQQTRC